VTNLAHASAIGAVQGAVFGQMVTVAVRFLASGWWDAGVVGPHFVLAATFSRLAQSIRDAFSFALDEPLLAHAPMINTTGRVITRSRFWVLAGGRALIFALDVFFIRAAFLATMMGFFAFIMAHAVATVVLQVARVTKAAAGALEVAVFRF